MSFDIIIDWEPYTTDFKGHEVIMKLRPLKTWASVLLTPIVRESQEKISESEKKIISISDINNIDIRSKVKDYMDKNKVGRNQALIAVFNTDPDFENLKIERDIPDENEINFAYRVQAISKKIFPDHIKDFEGITVNKLAITTDILCEESIFGPLCIDIISELIKRSNLSEQEEKNLEGPSIMPISDENTRVAHVDGLLSNG